MEIRKLGILYFSLFTWYQSQERKPNFLGDRVSFRSPSPPPDLLLTTAAAANRRRHCRRRLFGKLFSGRKPEISRRTRPIYPPVATPPATRFSRAVTRRLSPATCRPRAGACGRVPSSPATGLHTQGRPVPSWSSIPLAVQPEPSLSTFWPFLPPPSATTVPICLFSLQ